MGGTICFIAEVDDDDIFGVAGLRQLLLDALHVTAGFAKSRTCYSKTEIRVGSEFFSKRGFEGATRCQRQKLSPVITMRVLFCETRIESGLKVAVEYRCVIHPEGRRHLACKYFLM